MVMLKASVKGGDLKIGTRALPRAKLITLERPPSKKLATRIAGSASVASRTRKVYSHERRSRWLL